MIRPTPTPGGGSVGGNKQQRTARRFFALAVMVKLCIVSFYFGYRSTKPPPSIIHTSSSGVNNDVTYTIRRSSSSGDGSVLDSSTVDCAGQQQQLMTELSPSLQRRISKRVKVELAALEKNDPSSTNQRISYHHGSTHDVPSSLLKKEKKLFPESVRGYVGGALRISTKEILQTYDFGVPIKKYQPP